MNRRKTWPHRRSWGYGSAGGLGLVLIIVIVLLLLGRLQPLQVQRVWRNAGTVTGGRNWMRPCWVGAGLHQITRYDD